MPPTVKKTEIRNGSRELRVRNVSFNHSKGLRLSNGERLILHRYACVGPKDVVMRQSGSRSRLTVKCRNGKTQLQPSYSAKETYRIGRQELHVTIKEIDTEAEQDGYQRLSDYHYRGVKLHGRHVPLIATTDNPLFPKVLGYVDLTTPFLMSRPRRDLFDAEFDDGQEIRWKRWDQSAMRRYTNLIVRIARCVVHPELRGFSFSRVLLKHAFRYAASHWQVGGLKPYFIEITADMLKYLPFAENAGMNFIGYTEGNLKRLRKDMTYILNNYRRVSSREILREESAGIVDLQVSYVARLKKILAGQSTSLKSLLGKMNFRKGTVNTRQYAMFHGLIRMPKPIYMKGLTAKAEEFVKRRTRELTLSKDNFEIPLPTRPLRTPIQVKDLSITIRTRVRRTKKSTAVQEAFGIRPEALEYGVIEDINLELRPGEKLLVVGPSGSGKTLFLSNVMGKVTGSSKFHRVETGGSVVLPKETHIGRLRPLSNSQPIIEQFGGADFRRAVYVLNMAGLSEAYLYLKHFGELSAGQQYRAMFAKLIDQARNVWVADEFCSTLDPVTARLVTQNLRKLADRFGVTLIVAAPHYSSFLETLMPDKVLMLRGYPDTCPAVFRPDHLTELGAEVRIGGIDSKAYEKSSGR